MNVLEGYEFWMEMNNKLFRLVLGRVEWIRKSYSRSPWIFFLGNEVVEGILNLEL